VNSRKAWLKAKPQGEARGEARGEAKGEAKMLRLQLEYRFKKLPKWATDRLASAMPLRSKSGEKRLLEEESRRHIRRD